ncbi:MAG TPA: hypothetical protein DIT67_03975 [Octadecabacter sp.]|nr:hypothetical protein [Octadecabacter sp.]
MSDIVAEHEVGCVRVFHFDPPNDDGPIFQFQTAIGVAGLKAEDVQHVIIDELGDMPLRSFLSVAYDIDTAALDNVAELDEVSGHVFIVRSSAFLDRPVTLTTDGAARLVAALWEPSKLDGFAPPIKTESAEGILTPPAKKTPSDAAMSGRIATVALLIMALLVILMIWVAS